MRMTVIAALGIVIALGGVARVVAAGSTIEAEASLDVRLWQRFSDGALHISTRAEGGEWVTHDELFRMRPTHLAASFSLSDPVTLSVPVSVEVSAPPAAETAASLAAAGAEPAGPARCCTVRGMSDNPAARREVVSQMREVIAFAREHFGFTHSGPITINIAYTPGGLGVRYREAFGESLGQLPSECSFQRGEHMFFGPACRSDERALAAEWIRRATGAVFAGARWERAAMVDYYLSYYLEGAPPSLRDDRIRRALFFEDAADLRAGRASDEMALAAMLYAIRAHGSTGDWLDFYRDVRDGREEGEAFEAAFGVPLSRLYERFEEWAGRQKEILLVTSYGSCLEASRHISARPLSEGGGFASFRVPLEWDEDGDGYVCEGYATVEEETLTCRVIGELTAAE